MRKKKQMKMTKKGFDADTLNQILDVVIAYEPYWHASDWSKASGLSKSTCHRLLYRMTERPQFRSVCRMCYAAGVQIVTLPRRRGLKKSA